MSGEKRMRTQVGPDGHIDVVVPDWPVGQPVEVTIRAVPEPTQRRSAKEILAQSPGHRVFKTVEEVDAYFRTERDSWDD